MCILFTSLWNHKCITDLCYKARQRLLSECTDFLQPWTIITFYFIIDILHVICIIDITLFQKLHFDNKKSYLLQCNDL